MRFLQGAATLALAALVIGGAAGCSGAAKPDAAEKPAASNVAVAPEGSVGSVYSKAKKFLSQAKSLHYKGAFQSAQGPDAVEFFGQLDGKNYKDISSSELGQLTILLVGDKTFMQGDEKYISSSYPADKVKDYANKWMVPDEKSASATPIPSDGGDALTESPQVLMTKWLTQGTAAALEKDATPATKTGDTYELKSADGAVFTINAADYSLKKVVLSPKADPTGSFDFDQWNAVAPFTAPADSEIVKVSS